MSEEFKPLNQDRDPRYNMEPGMSIVQGSPYANEMQKHEQFPGKYGGDPGNPYRYRPFPKMIYRAQIWNGKALCMAPPPNPLEYSDPREYERKEELARRFSESCTRIVRNEGELSRAFEDNWRESPDEAVAALNAREGSKTKETAHRLYDDRNMSDKAKAEAAAQSAEAGAPLPEVIEQPRARRARLTPTNRKPRKSKPAPPGYTA